MATFVITVIGDDRVGLVESLADVVASAGGNWERSEMTELAGKFAGIVMVTLNGDRADELATNRRALEDVLDISMHEVADTKREQTGLEVVALDLVSDDRPGLVREISAILTRHGVNVTRLESSVGEAPMAGGTIFTCQASLQTRPEALGQLQADLENLATELMVELAITTAD